MPNTPPVIDSITPGTTANPVVQAQVGDKIPFSVTGHDADTRIVTAQFVLSDQAGNKSPAQTRKIQFSDTLKLEVTTDDGTPVAISGMTAIIG